MTSADKGVYTVNHESEVWRVLHMGSLGVPGTGAGWCTPKVCFSPISPAKRGANWLPSAVRPPLSSVQGWTRISLPALLLVQASAVHFGLWMFLQDIRHVRLSPLSLGVARLLSEWWFCHENSQNWAGNWMPRAFSGKFFLLGTSGQVGEVIKTTLPWAFWHFQPPPVNRMKAAEVFINRAVQKLVLRTRVPNLGSSLVWIFTLIKCYLNT